jgi:hypothetical protein
VHTASKNTLHLPSLKKPGGMEYYQVSLDFHSHECSCTCSGFGPSRLAYAARLFLLLINQTQSWRGPKAAPLLAWPSVKLLSGGDINPVENVIVGNGPYHILLDVRTELDWLLAYLCDAFCGNSS